MSVQHTMCALCFVDLSSPIYGAEGWSLALTLMVTTGFQKGEAMGAETERQRCLG